MELQQEFAARMYSKLFDTLSAGKQSAVTERVESWGSPDEAARALDRNLSYYNGENNRRPLANRHWFTHGQALPIIRIAIEGVLDTASPATREATVSRVLA